MSLERTIRQMMSEAVDPTDTGGAEEASMAMRQVKAIRHFVDGIEQRVGQQGDMEEWYQNKLTKAHDYLKTLYAYGKGDKMMEEVDKGKLLKALKKKLSDEGGAAGFKPLKDVAKEMDVDLTPEMLKGMDGIKQHRDGDYILEQVELTEEQIKVGDYQTTDFDICPVATKLYKKIEATPMAVKSAKLQDMLFKLEKKAIKSGVATEDDVERAEELADKIMDIAKEMGMEDEHEYVQGHVDKIAQIEDEGDDDDKEEMDEMKVRGKEVYDKTFANRTQADNYAKKHGGRVQQVGRVFYVFKEELEEAVKYPHMMYDPKTGKGVEAKSPEDHEKYAKMGYTHDKPEDMDEAKRDPSKSGGTGYDLYHKDFSSAMKHAYDYAKKKLGVDIDPKEIDDKVASGPRKPSKGKTNTYRLMGKDGKKGVQIQVANLDDKKFELNMYKESVELDENKNLIKDYQDMKATGKKDSNILDALMSMPKYKRMSKDQMAKIIGDAKRKGIFKEEVELDEQKPPFDVSKGDYLGAAKELTQYAKTKGGMDKDDFLSFANRMREITKRKSPQVLSKFARDLESLDTSPREKIIDVMRNNGIKVTFKGNKMMVEGFGAELTTAQRLRSLMDTEVPVSESVQPTSVGMSIMEKAIASVRERKLTDTELKRREEIAKDLPDAEFKKRYGDRWMEVKMATATKMAKGEE